MPPPPDAALLSEKVLLVTVSVLSLRMAPPPPPDALLPEKVLLVTFSVPLQPFALAPPPPDALLSEKVLLVTVSGPSLKMAPPLKSVALAIVRFFRLSVAPVFTTKTP